MDISTLMVLLFLVSTWTVQCFNIDRKVSDVKCDTLLSSVRMEVSPELLRVICSNTDSITLVVECGSNIWYETVAGFCISSDLNIGYVLLDQPLLSSTIRIQLLQSGNVLDTAKLAVLTSEHLFHYRISVWGDKNTRFVLAVGVECTPSSENHLPDSLYDEYQSFLEEPPQNIHQENINKHLLETVPDTWSNNSRTLVTGYGVPMMLEYVTPKTFEKTPQINSDRLLSRYPFAQTKTLHENKDDSSFQNQKTKIEIYRSKLLNPGLTRTTTPKDFMLLQFDGDDRDDDVKKTTTESSELAKLRWMEEKRILFENRMKFIRSLYPESADIEASETDNIYSDYSEQQIDEEVPDQSENSEKLPTRIDNHKSVNVPLPSEPLTSENAHLTSEDILREDDSVSVGSLVRSTEIQYRDNYPHNSSDQPWRLNSLPYNSYEDSTNNFRHQKLKFRRFESSSDSVKPTNADDFETNHTSLLSNQSLLVQEKNTILPPSLIQGTRISQLNKNITITSKTDTIKPDLFNFKVINTSSVNITKTFVHNKDNSAVYKQASTQKGNTDQKVQTLFESSGDTLLNSSLPASQIYISSMDSTHPTNRTSNTVNAKPVSFTQSARGSGHNSTDSETFFSVKDSGIEGTTQSIAFRELLSMSAVTSSTLPIAARVLPATAIPLPVTSTLVPVTTSSLPVTSRAAPVSESPLLVKESSVPAIASTLPVATSSLPVTVNLLPVTTGPLSVVEKTLPVTTATLRTTTTSQQQVTLTEESQTVSNIKTKDSLPHTTTQTASDVESYTQVFMSTNNMTSLSKSVTYILQVETKNNLVRQLPSNLKSELDPSVTPLSVTSSSDTVLEKFTNVTHNTVSTYPSNGNVIKPPTGLNDKQHDKSAGNSTKSPSLHRSASLKMALSNVEEQSTQSQNIFASDRENQQSSVSQINLKRESVTPRIRIGRTMTARENKATKLLTEGKVFAKKRETHLFSEPSVPVEQSSIFSSENGTELTSAQLQEEIQESIISQLNVNTSTADSIQQQTSPKEQNPTAESFNHSVTSQAVPSTGTSQASDDEQEDMEKDSFWPIVAALVIGIPSIVILGIVITVLYRKRKTDPFKLFQMKVLKSSRNSSVSNLHGETTGNRRHRTGRTSSQVTLEVPRQDNVRPSTEISLRETQSKLGLDIPRPQSIDV